jgi:hypothetical protein
VGGGSAPSVERFGALDPSQNDVLNYIIRSIFPTDQQPDLEGNPQLSSIDPYPGTVTPGLSLGQQAGLGIGGTGSETALNTLRELMQAKPSYTSDPEAVNRFFTESIEKPATTQFYRDTLPEIEAGLASRGLNRGPLAGRQLSRAGEEFSAQLNDIRGNLVYADEEAATAAKETAQDRSLGAIDAYNQLRSQDIGSRLELGAMTRDVEGQQLGEEFQNYLQQQPEYNPWLGYLTQALGTQAFSYANVPGQASNAGTGVSAGLGILGLLAALSTRKAKDKIDDIDPEQILTKLIGLPVDRWRYKPEFFAGIVGEHIGTYAEDFNAAFDLEGGDKIQLIDMVGVLLAGIQGLAEQNRKQAQKLQQLERSLSTPQSDRSGARLSHQRIDNPLVQGA